MKRVSSRSVYKILMHNRGVSFWGRRAYVRVNLPLSVIPEPLPCIPEHLSGDIGFGGEGRVGGDKRIFTSIGSISSTGDPREREREHTPYFVTAVNRWRSSEPWFEWWEGWEAVFEDRGPENLYLAHEDALEIRELPEADVLPFKQRKDWESKWIYGQEGGTSPVLEPFITAADFCETRYWSAQKIGNEDRLVLTFSVKWVRPYRRYGFASALARAVTNARALGVDARIYRS